MRANVLIATPTYGGHVTTEYMMSIIRLRDHFASVGIDSSIYLNDCTIIHLSRNMALSRFHATKIFTHLLFVDSDMEFSPETIMRMLDHEKEVIGCICPARSVNLQAFYNAALHFMDFEKAKAASQTFIAADVLALRPVGDGYDYDIKDGLVRTLQIGCGVTLLRRSVAEKLFSSFPEIVIQGETSIAYKNILKGERMTIIQAFDPVDAGDGIVLPEDLSFCFRWRNRCDGEVWACVDQKIGHVGAHKSEGVAAEHLALHKPTRRRDV